METSALSLSAFSQRSQQRCEAMVTLSEVIHIATEVLARCGDGGGGAGGGGGRKGIEEAKKQNVAAWKTTLDGCHDNKYP